MIIKETIDNYKKQREIAVEKLRYVAETTMEDEDVQEGYPDGNGRTVFPGTKIKVTWCHRYTDRCLKILGIDPSDLYYRNSIDWSTVQYLYSKAIELSKDPGSWVKEIAKEDVNNTAYWGVPILVLAPEGYGHAALVCPPDKQDDKVIRIYNQGSSQVKGLKTLYEVYNKNGLSPLFFVLQKKLK